MKSTRSPKKWHKYLGLPLCFFGLMFGLSGLILNHRQFFSSWEISRKLLPSYLHLHDWNLGSLKATLPISPDSILIYGSEGVLLTDSNAHNTHIFSDGMLPGVDNQNINAIVKDTIGNIFATSTFNVYKLNTSKNKWQLIDNVPNNDERIMDMSIGDGKLVIMTRSHLITAVPPYHTFDRLTLPAPSNYDGKVSLFRTTWLIHSGEIAGLAGKIIVDILGIIFVLLCITGIMLFSFPKILKRRKSPQKKTRKAFKYAYKYHYKIGLYTFYPLLFLTLTGWFLRPPLLLTIVFGRTHPIPYSTMDNPNPWHDKLRSIRYDQYHHDWIFYSSDGFYQTKDFHSTPQAIPKAPEISVMGINVFQQQDDRHWLIGSFSGLIIWDRMTGKNYDYFTHKIVRPKKPGPPNLSNAISGYTSDFKSTPMPVKYNDGISNPSIFPMPTFFLGRISLWHLALEVHTGRIYSIPIIGPLFIFLIGLLSIITLLTGHIICKRINKKKNKVGR